MCFQSVRRRARAAIFRVPHNIIKRTVKIKPTTPICGAHQKCLHLWGLLARTLKHQSLFSSGQLFWRLRSPKAVGFGLIPRWAAQKKVCSICSVSRECWRCVRKVVQHDHFKSKTDTREKARLESSIDTIRLFSVGLWACYPFWRKRKRKILENRPRTQTWYLLHHPT